jgi:hypothetical protein
VGLGRGVKIPPSGAREGVISRVYGCFYIGIAPLKRRILIKNIYYGGYYWKENHIRGGYIGNFL